MSEIYGHRWVSTYGECDSGTWLQGLQDLTPDQVAHGLSVVMELGEEWPPSLPSFRKMCKGEHEIEQKKNGFGLDYVPQFYREQSASEVKRLENTASKETRESNLGKMRDLLKGARA